jgi:hypothetical protein
MDNGSNARLDRIEKIIATMVRAQRDRDEASAKAQRQRDEAMAKAQRQRDEAMAKAQRERDEAMARAQFERDESTAKAQLERDEATAKAQREHDAAMAKAQHEREIESEKHRAYHDREIRRIDARLSRFVKLGVEEARRHRVRMQALDEKITQLAAAQLITEEKLQRFISSLSTNGFGSRT